MKSLTVASFLMLLRAELTISAAILPVVFPLYKKSDFDVTPSITATKSSDI